MARLSDAYNNSLNCWQHMIPDFATAISPEHSSGVAIRTIIADDERLAREKLRILLASEANIKLVAECHDGQQALSADSHLPGGSASARHTNAGNGWISGAECAFAGGDACRHLHVCVRSICNPRV